MIPHLVYYQLVILVLLWLCVMLPHLWPSPPGGMPKTLGLNNLRANGHPNGGPGVNSTAPRATAFFRSITARCFMASKQQ